MDERRFRAGLSRGFEDIQRADGVGVEIVERDGCVRGHATVVRPHERRDRADPIHEREHAGTVTDIEFVMRNPLSEAARRR